MTKQQIEIIVANINEMLNQAKDKVRALEELCDADYLLGRKAYPVTAIVYTAFNTENQNIPDFTVQKVQYGGKRKLFLPELFNDGTMIEVFGDSSKPLSTNEVKTKLRLMGDKLHLLIFSVDKEKYILTKLQLLSLSGFDEETGDVLVNERETLYEAA